MRNVSSIIPSMLRNTLEAMDILCVRVALNTANFKMFGIVPDQSKLK